MNNETALHLNKSEVWLKTTQVAAMRRVSRQYIGRLVREGKYERVRITHGVGGKSGMNYEIALSALAVSGNAAHAVNGNAAQSLNFAPEIKKLQEKIENHQIDKCKKTQIKEMIEKIENILDEKQKPPSPSSRPAKSKQHKRKKREPYVAKSQRLNITAAEAVTTTAACAVSGKTAHAVSGKTALAVNGKTAYAVNGNAAHAVSGKTAHAVSGKTACAANGKTAQAVSPLAATSTALRAARPPDKDNILSCSKEKRDAADDKLHAITAYRAARLDGASIDEFLTEYNAGRQEPISRSQLMRWQAKLKKHGAAGLIDNRGGGNKSESSIPGDVRDCFYALYMTQEQRSVAVCYDLIKEHFKGRELPTVSAFERFVKDIPKLAIIKHRLGPKAYDESLPNIIRDKKSIDSNDYWNSDHRQLDVFVKNKKGKIFRPWVTAFYDLRSNFVTGAIIREANPNAAVIKECFKKSVEAHGVPRMLYFDNGKDYQSKGFSEAFPMSVTNALDIGIVFALPYNAKAKPIERFFGTMSCRFDKRFETYTGKDAKDRPEQMKISNERIAAMALSFEEFSQLFYAYVDEYNNTIIKGGDLKGKTPSDVFAGNLAVKRVADLSELRVICGTIEQRKVGKNGIRILDNYYRSEHLAEHYGKTVYVSYYSDNLDEVTVLDADMAVLCMAEAAVKLPFSENITDEEYRLAQKERKKIREAIKKYAPEKQVPSVRGIIAKNRIEEKYNTEESPLSEIDIHEIETGIMFIDVNTPGKARARQKEREDMSGLYASHFSGED
jgi:transposase InsO family protein